MSIDRQTRNGQKHQFDAQSLRSLSDGRRMVSIDVARLAVNAPQRLRPSAGAAARSASTFFSSLYDFCTEEI